MHVETDKLILKFTKQTTTTKEIEKMRRTAKIILKNKKDLYYKIETLIIKPQ